MILPKKAVIFDLDGVLVHTEQYHFITWQYLATTNGWQYNPEIADTVKGKNRMESLETLLQINGLLQKYTIEEKARFCEAKNEHYLSLLTALNPSDASPGTFEVLSFLKKMGYKIALASSSKNAAFISEKLNISTFFEVFLDGNQQLPSKPAPDIFLRCAGSLGVTPEECLVIEDAPAGFLAAKSAGMSVLIYNPKGNCKDCITDLKEILSFL